MLKRFEFMSPAWIAMAREQILRALEGKDLSTIRFTLCEEFTNPPEHLRSPGAQSIGFYVRLGDGRVEVAIAPQTMLTARSSVTTPMPSRSPATRRLLPPTRL